MGVLLLVRHALTDATGKRLTGWTPGVHLSERGRDQAEAVARRLAALKPAAIYSSPLERCRETAEPLAKASGRAIRVLEDLGEVRYGEWTGRSLAQLARTNLWKSVQRSPSSVRFPGGETLAETQVRAAAAAERIAATHARAIAALFTHADVVRLLLAHFAGIHLDLFQRLVVDPASVSAVWAGQGIPRLLRVNDTGTLEDLVPRRRPRLRG
jgi:probable phosphomutase (TIGR03848 family)